MNYATSTVGVHSKKPGIAVVAVIATAVATAAAEIFVAIIMML